MCGAAQRSAEQRGDTLGQGAKGRNQTGDTRSIFNFSYSSG